MKRTTLTTAVIAGIAGVAGIANMASAVNLNPDGLGQVLLFPYYTVNAHQQTLISVVNTTSIGKAVKVRFLEGYNSREVLDFNLFMSPYDVWTANVFALADGSVGTAGAGIFSADNSCTAPAFTTTGLANGHGYQAFLDYAYAGGNTDTGPTGVGRTTEGHFEMISMADIVSPSALATDTTHIAGVPPGCSSAEADFEGTAANTVPPTSGLFGAASVVNVASGTYYAYNADALDGFTLTKLNSGTGSLTPSLSQVNDAGVTSATSYVFAGGKLLTSTYPVAAVATAFPSQIDAVSSVFDTANLYNEYQVASDGSVGTDWVVTFPTKRFYVDSGTYTGLTAAQAPFEYLFGANVTGNGHGLSCTVVGITTYDREEGKAGVAPSGFSPPPPNQPASSICHETNVITFNQTGANSVLGSGLALNIAPFGTAGWANIDLNSANASVPHAMDPATGANTNVFHGLPVTGFEAVSFAKGNNVGGAIQYYSGVYRHRESRNCTQAAGACS